MKWNQQMFCRHARELGNYLAPLAAVLGRSERRVAAARYVQGLLMPGQRKSLEPMAARLGVDAQSLQQFVAASPWDESAVWRVIRKEIVPQMEPLQSWIVDESGWLKQGRSSVGVSHQYCGSVGKQANCQVSVELVVTDGEAVAPVGGRLYLPESWTSDLARCRAAGVPAGTKFQTKLEIALSLIDQALGDGIAPAPILADSVYGDSSDFRAELRRRKLEFFVQIAAGGHKAWTRQPVTEKKFKRRYVAQGTPKTQTLEEIAMSLPSSSWQPASWKTADGRRGSTRLAWCEVYMAHGLRKPNGDVEKVWLVVDWPEKSPKPYHCFLAELHRPMSKPRCLRLSRGRWPIEQYFQRAKDDLGLDHYEGRSWIGFHHHLVMSAIAYLFVMLIHLRSKKNFRPDVGESSQGDPAVAGEINRILFLLRHEIR